MKALPGALCKGDHATIFRTTRVQWYQEMINLSQAICRGGALFREDGGGKKNKKKLLLDTATSQTFGGS